jgi:tRNA U38,U39,U40 pseudouridine synthase TruA
MTEQPERTTDADLHALRDTLRVALDDGTPRRIKTILQDLNEEIRVTPATQSNQSSSCRRFDHRQDRWTLPRG